MNPHPIFGEEKIPRKNPICKIKHCTNEGNIEYDTAFGSVMICEYHFQQEMDRMRVGVDFL